MNEPEIAGSRRSMLSLHSDVPQALKGYYLSPLGSQQSVYLNFCVHSTPALVGASVTN